MKVKQQNAVIIFIDNSATSIDGDFIPNRLEAQKNTVEIFAQNMYTDNENSQIALGTLSSTEFGIRTSFTSNFNRLRCVMSSITPGGSVLLEQGIKLAFLAIKHCSIGQSAGLKMIFFMNYLVLLELNDTTIESINKNLAINRKVNVQFFIIGNDESNKTQKIVRKIFRKTKNTSFLIIEPGDQILSDVVMSKEMGMLKKQTKYDLSNQPDGLRKLRDTLINNDNHGIIKAKPPEKRARKTRSASAHRRAKATEKNNDDI